MEYGIDVYYTSHKNNCRALGMNLIGSPSAWNESDWLAERLE